MADSQMVWQRIRAHDGQTFHTIRRLPFTYRVMGNYLITNRAQYNLARSNLEKALGRVPLSGPSEIKDLRGSSYVYAILMDARIRGNDW